MGVIINDIKLACVNFVWQKGAHLVKYIVELLMRNVKEAYNDTNLIKIR